MDFQTLDALRRRHPAWRLLVADSAPLVASFLHRSFVEPNVRTLARQELVAKLDDYLFHLRDAFRSGIRGSRPKCAEPTSFLHRAILVVCVPRRSLSG